MADYTSSETTAFPRSSFVESFPLSDAPETRANRAGAFSGINKMIPFVEKLLRI
jgi:hypothetical protein